MRASDFKPAPSEASVFHALAGAFLADLGFALVDDPQRQHGTFNVSFARYRSPRGLRLSIGFEPGDSNTAEIWCGRLWHYSGHAFMSNHYAALARRLGFDVPLFYKLGYGEDKAVTMKVMLADLERTLPAVVSRVTLDDLVHVEREERGTEARARELFGPEYLQHVDIESFAAH